MTTAVLICPGRGTYNKPELGTLGRHFPDTALMARFDDHRRAAGQDTLTELDGAARFSGAKHSRGDNASALIFAASYGDFLCLADDIEIVAVTGNSMGWYTALACGGALSAEDGFDVVNTMGRMMHQDGTGGQIVYPHMRSDWTPNVAGKALLLDLVAQIDAQPNHALGLSIDLGGMLVLAGNQAGLAAFAKDAPPVDRFPMPLPGHAAFHSKLVAPVSQAALAHFSPALFAQPDKPMIDGRGHIWWPGSIDRKQLRDYTFGHQVTKPYDFTRAVTIAAQEFAPDLFILPGPGTTLGGAVAQSLIGCGWRGMTNKPDFQNLQDQKPMLMSMGRDDQRPLVSTPSK